MRWNKKQFSIHQNFFYFEFWWLLYQFSFYGIHKTFAGRPLQMINNDKVILLNLYKIGLLMTSISVKRWFIVNGRQLIYRTAMYSFGYGSQSHLDKTSVPKHMYVSCLSIWNIYCVLTFFVCLIGQWTIKWNFISSNSLTSVNTL